MLDIDNSKRRSRPTSPTTRAVNERTIKDRYNGSIGGEVVIPGCDVSLYSNRSEVEQSAPVSKRDDSGIWIKN